MSPGNRFKVEVGQNKRRLKSLVEVRHPPGRPFVHGAKRFWRIDIFTAEQTHLARLVDGVMMEFVVDLGGEESLSTGQIILLAQVRRLISFLLLADEHLAKGGSIFKPDGNPSPPLDQFYLAAQNSLIRIVEKLGLKRVSPGDDLESYLKAKYSTGSQNAPQSTISPGPVPVKAGKKAPHGPRKAARNKSTEVDSE